MDDVRKGWETARSSGRALTLLSLSFGLSLNRATTYLTHLADAALVWGL